MSSPSKPARLRSTVATTIAVADPISHMAAITGPGCATQFAPADRREAAQAKAAPARAAPRTVRKNDATPRAIARALVRRSRMRIAARIRRIDRAFVAIHLDHG